MIERLTEEEFHAFLAYGDPKSNEQIAYDQAHDYDETGSHSEWISTLASTTYPTMTFGYNDVPYMSTALH